MASSKLRPSHGIYETNQSTWRYHKPYVKEGDWVKKGDLLANGRASLRGNIAVGQNLLVSYIPWDGLNFEDAIVGSEALKTKESGTSIHVEEWESTVKETVNGREIFVPFSKELIDQLQGGNNDILNLSTIESENLFIRKSNRFKLWSSSKYHAIKNTELSSMVPCIFLRCFQYVYNFINFKKEKFNLFFNLLI
jgi:hypothetical protein